MAMIEWDAATGSFTFRAAKYSGKTIREVAKECPGYLTWLWGQSEILGALSDAACDELESVMREMNIPFKKGRKGSSTPPASDSHE